MDKSIVFGTCWFNESVETIVNFFTSSLKSLKSLGFKVIPIIFSAKYNYNIDEINVVKESIDNVIILQNTTNIFPNKNYGVALITNKAKDLNADFVAVIDSDWDIKENMSFINNTILKLLDSNCDIVIPNIGNASGRSNLLIGRTIINLFYPEYKDVLLSVFPGSLIAVTSKLFEIVNDINYHYDWGGEWDIISLAIKKNMRLTSSLVDVRNIRHRPNNSKMQDSFQIWKAVFSNVDIINRFDNLKKCSIRANSKDKLAKVLTSKTYDAKEMIDIINNLAANETQKQILYMILYPLAYLTGKIDEIPTILDDVSEPYDKNELNEILDLAVYCARNALINCEVNFVYERSKNMTGRFFSSWSIDNQKKALIDYTEV